MALENRYFDSTYISHRWVTSKVIAVCRDAQPLFETFSVNEIPTVGNCSVDFYLSEWFDE